VISQVTSEAEFSSFARRLSATASRGRGGRLDWTPLGNLPPVLRPLILGLAPGEVTQPIPIPEAVALFQLRGIEETDAPEREFAAVEYAAYYISGGRSAETLQIAEKVKANVDVCDDLYGIAQGQPEEVLERGSLPPAEIPDDIAIELAKLDPGEVSLALTRAEGRTLVFLMLCGRTPSVAEEVDRGQVRENLRQSRFSGFANALMEELRASADIEVVSN
jgi:peptidyl-prolyl cis-trans isomerase SurA